MSPTIESQAEKFQSTRRLTDNVYELLPESDPDVEVVFFHGLQMKGSDPAYSFWRTWKMRNSEDCWPEILLPKLLIYRLGEEEYKCKLRVLSVSYEGRPDLGEDGRGTDRSDEFLVLESLIQELILGRGCVGQRAGVPVFLVGHDLGGILIKRLVMMVEQQAADMPDEHNSARALSRFLENLKSVFFYATPHSGSKAIEEIAQGIDGNDENQMLRLMKVLNKETGRINEDFQMYRRGEIGSKRSRLTTYAVHAANRTNEGGFKSVLVVPEGSARSHVDYFYTAVANHFSVCQPEDETSTPVQMLGGEIVNEVQKAKGHF